LNLRPPGPEDWSHEKSTTCTERYGVRRSTTDVASRKAFQRCLDTQSHSVGFGGGHKTGHTPGVNPSVETVWYWHTRRSLVFPSQIFLFSLFSFRMIVFVGQVGVECAPRRGAPWTGNADVLRWSTSIWIIAVRSPQLLRTATAKNATIRLRRRPWMLRRSHKAINWKKCLLSA
jgi:hypothetical protein